MRISDWSSDVCSSDLAGPVILGSARQARGMDSSNKKIEIVFAADSNCPVQAVSDPGHDRCRTRGDQFGACSCQATWPTAMPDCRLAGHSRCDSLFASKRKILLTPLLARSRFPQLGTLEGVERKT